MTALKLTLLAAALTLSACSHYSDDLSSLDSNMKSSAQIASASAPQDIAPAAGAASGSFRHDLAREYYDLATTENTNSYDYKASKAFTAKAMAAQAGRTPIPSKVSEYDIPYQWAGELSEARKTLIVALKSQNTPDNAAALARAQTRYECWLERAEEAVDETHYAACKAEFEQSIASLVTPAAGDVVPPTTYDIGFAANSAVADMASQTKLNLIAQFLNDPKNAAYTATLTGFGMASGEYADSVTSARVKAVQDMLVQKGVSISRLNPVVSPAQPAGTEAKVQVALIAGDGGTVTAPGTTTRFVPITPTPVP